MSNYWTGTRLDDIAEEWRKSRDAVERATEATKAADAALAAARKALASAEAAIIDAQKILTVRRKEELQSRKAMRDALAADLKKAKADR